MVRESGAKRRSMMDEVVKRRINGGRRCLEASCSCFESELLQTSKRRQRTKTLTTSNLVMKLSLFATLFVIQLASGAQYVAPGECTWTHIADTNFDVSLKCNVGTISPSGLNFSLIQAEHTISLKLICDDYLYQSRIENGSLSHLRFLKSLSIENCKLAQLTDGALTGLQTLRNLTIRTHNQAWGALSLNLNHESLSHLKHLEILDLGFNNMGKLPEDLFCPLTSLKVLNLTHNRLQGFASLGVVDHTTGQLCLQELQQLDLSHNSITFLSETGVASLKNLRALHLQNNQITEVAELSLSALSRLQIIDLSNNQLTSIPSRTFRESEELRQLYLQNNSLSYLQPGIFSGLSKLFVLNLSHNEISSEWITPDTFADLIRVVILDLGFNRLKKINGTTFQSQYSLQILYLRNNEIEQIGDHSFSALYNLHTLILDENRLKSLGAHTLNGLYVLSKLALDDNEIAWIHEDAFKNCSNLQDLSLQGNILSKVPKAVSSLRFLKTLQLSGNVIVDIKNASYLGLQHMQNLNLTRNQIANLSRGSLRDMPSLKILDISTNRLQSLEHGVFDDAPSLTEIHLQNNQLADINGLFMNLQNLRLLNVSRNRITWFDYALIPKELIELDIHSNEIEIVGNYFELEAGLHLHKMNAAFNSIREISASTVPDQIRVLRLNNNNISLIHPFTFLAKHNLSFVDLRKNLLTTLDTNALRLKPFIDKPLPNFLVSENPYYCDCTMEWLQRINNLDASRNYPRIVDLDSVRCQLPFHRETTYLPLIKANSSNFLCKYKTHCFALCHCCDFDACDCEMMCPENCTCYSDQTWNTNIVDCSARDYVNIPQRIPMDVTELYLDGNNIHTLGSHTFIGRKNLKALYLNNSNIYSISNRTFNGLNFLTILHLEYNQLTALNGYEFETLHDLRELHLHHNHISIINNKTFSPLRSLQVLHLENNAIVDFQLWSLNLNSDIRSVYLSHNLWSCKCDFMQDFHEYLQAYENVIKDSKNLRCYYNGSAVGPYLWEFNILNCANYSQEELENNKRINDSVSFFPRDLLEDYLPFLVALLCAIVLVFILLVCFCVYRKELQVWMYSKYGIRLFQKSRYPPETEKLFDAFVSYCKKDETFIAQILAPELECGHPPYRLCLRYRDLPVTGYVTEAITEAIESSHRTVILLSEQFLKSEACRFELKVAHHECQVNKNHKLAVVLLDKGCLNQLDSDAKVCLRSAPVIAWGDKRFWEKLRFAMPPGRGQKPMNCPDVRASIEFKRAMNMTMNMNSV